MKKLVIFSLIIFIGNCIYSQDKIYTVEEYIKTVSANPLRYEGQNFTIKGIVEGVMLSESLIRDSTILVSLEGNTGTIFFFSVHFNRNAEIDEKLSNIWKGDIITLNGICKDKNTVESARIISIENKSTHNIKNAYIIYDFDRQFTQNMFAPIGKIFEITCVITEIERSGSRYIVWFGDHHHFKNSAYFESDQKDALMEAETGKKFTFEGKVISVYKGIGPIYTTFRDCKVIKVE